MKKKALRKRLHFYIIYLGGDKMQLKKSEMKIIQLLLASDDNDVKINFTNLGAITVTNFGYLVAPILILQS